MTNRMPTELVDGVRKAKADLDAARERFAEELKNQTANIFKVFFDLHPDAQAISWMQYTPFFNDGDPCEFSVGRPYLVLESGEYPEWKIKLAMDDGKIDRDLGADFSIISEVLKTDGDTMQAIFGDHAKITATRDGITVEEYEDHD